MTTRVCSLAGATRTLALALAATVALTSCSPDAGGGDLPTEEREELLRVSARQLEKLLSYDASTLKSDVAEVDEVAEGDFAQQYQQLLGGTAAQRIRRDRAASAASVLEIGIRDDREDKPVLLVFVRQTTTSRRLAGPRLDLSALEVAMVRDGDAWRITSMDKVAPIRAKNGRR